MGMANRSGDIEGFLDDADAYDGGEEGGGEDRRRSANRKPPPKGPKTTAWRDIEDKKEAARLKRALSEFYDDEK